MKELLLLMEKRKSKGAMDDSKTGFSDHTFLVEVLGGW
jgi:hypothetical protein